MIPAPSLQRKVKIIIRRTQCSGIPRQILQTLEDMKFLWAFHWLHFVVLIMFRIRRQCIFCHALKIHGSLFPLSFACIINKLTVTPSSGVVL